jgi:hypothetical protein
MILNGYYEYHKITCNKDDCPSKRSVLKTTKITKLLLGIYNLR